MKSGRPGPFDDAEAVVKGRPAQQGDEPRGTRLAGAADEARHLNHVFEAASSIWKQHADDLRIQKTQMRRSRGVREFPMDLCKRRYDRDLGLTGKLRHIRETNVSAPASGEMEQRRLRPNEPPRALTDLDDFNSERVYAEASA